MHRCNKEHLEVLHDVNASMSTNMTPGNAVSVEGIHTASSTAETLYVDRPTGSSRVLLKMSRVILCNGDISLDTYALLDAGSERTILLHDAAQQLSQKGCPEDLSLYSTPGYPHYPWSYSVILSVPGYSTKQILQLPPSIHCWRAWTGTTCLPCCISQEKVSSS